MHFLIQASTLKQTLSQLSRLIPHKPLIPAMGYMELRVDTGLHLSVITPQESLKTTLDIEVVSAGKALVPVKLFSEYVKQLPATEVTIRLEHGILHTEAGGHKATIPAASNEIEFPEMTFEGEVETWSLSVGELERITAMVGFSAGSDLNRPVLASIVFDKHEGKVQAVTTDGYRLSLLGDITPWDGTMTRVQIPAKTWSELTRLVSESGETMVVLEMAPSGFSARFGVTTLHGRYVDGEFPSYQKIIPTQQALEIELPVQEVKEAIRLALLFSPSESSLVKWHIEEGVLVIKADSPTQGEQLSHVPIRVLEGEKGEIAFNGRFVLEYLESVRSETVTFSMNNSTLPGKFSHQKGQLHLIMPVRL